MPAGDVYIIRSEAVVSGAISVLQVKAGASNAFEILRAIVTQRGSTTSAQEGIAIVRKTVPATVTSAVVGTTGNIFQRNPSGAGFNISLGASATGFTATNEGTDGDILLKEGFNVLNGWLYMPVPEERLYVPPGNTVALKFLNAPASQNWQFEVVVREL